MNEPTTVGLTEGGRDRLARLKEEGYFAEMADGYRFAIALALAHNGISEHATRRTIFNVGTLDPDGAIATAIRLIRDPDDEPVYAVAERLAEWGVDEMYAAVANGRLSFPELLAEADALTQIAGAK
jgi:hypothetical protein